MSYVLWDYLCGYKNWEIHFKQDLRSLGYVCNDLSKENLAILGSYQVVDIEGADELPDWFKEVPLVLVDRDSVYKK